MCVCHWPTLRGVCMNNDIVMFQPITVNPLKPRICRYLYNFKSSPPVPPVSTIFLDCSISLLHPTTAPSASFYCCVHIHVLQPLPTFSPVAKRRPPGHCPHSPLATCQPPPIFSATHATCLRLTPFPVTVFPPLCHPRPAPRNLSAPGGFFPSRVTLSTL